MSENKKKLDRRDFLKCLGGAAALTAAACSPATKSKSSNTTRSTSMELGEGKMEYRTTNRGDKVSLLGYGCMRWPKLAEPEANGNVIDQEAVNELVDYAIEHGVNYFDTAPVYMQGWSEHAMGVALSRHPRDKYYITTKLSNFNSTTWEREASLKIYHKSFKELKVDYIDYMLLHAVGNGSMKNFKARYIDNGMLDFLVEERAAGRIRNIGFSFHGDIAVYDYLLSLHDQIKWDFVQIQLNYLDWQHAEKLSKNNTNAEYLYSELEKRDIGAIIMEPLLGGRLASLPDHLSEKLLAERPDKSLASWAFRYAGTPSKVITVLSGMTYMEHLKDNIETYSHFEPITPEEDEMLMDIAMLMVDYPLVPCTACQYCMPCPYGLDIPAIFTHYNKCVCEGNFPNSTQDPEYVKERRAFLIGYDRSVPKLRQADHCISCKKCEIHCPQKIQIPQELRRVNEYIESLKQGRFDSDGE